MLVDLYAPMFGSGDSRSPPYGMVRVYGQVRSKSLAQYTTNSSVSNRGRGGNELIRTQSVYSISGWHSIPNQSRQFSLR